jgi:predicted ArsR family transcriptional regulator
MTRPTGNVDRALRLLSFAPMTRAELESSLGTSQQRVSEILRAVGAHVVGYRRPPRQGRPAPLYAVGEHEASQSRPIGRVSSVWDLGATV